MIFATLPHKKNGGTKSRSSCFFIAALCCCIYSVLTYNGFYRSKELCAGVRVMLGIGLYNGTVLPPMLMTEAS